MPYYAENTVLPQTKRDLSRTTASLKPAEIVHKWTLIDAENLILGRLASIIANRLRGKHSPQYSPHVDCGDRVIVINAEKVVITGDKLNQNYHYRHTGFSGGIKAESVRSILTGKQPQKLIKKAVWGMLSDGPLAKERFRNLYVYVGSIHPHAAQQPRFLDVAALNAKNVKGQNVTRTAPPKDQPGFIVKTKPLTRDQAQRMLRYTRPAFVENEVLTDEQVDEGFEEVERRAREVRALLDTFNR